MKRSEMLEHLENYLVARNANMTFSEQAKELLSLCEEFGMQPPPTTKQTWKLTKTGEGYHLLYNWDEE